MKLRLRFLLSLIIACSTIGSVSAGYDTDAVNNAWLDWTNAERAKYWVQALSMSDSLNMTALDWSKYSSLRWYIDHRRPGQINYYDYKKINAWFGSEWISFKNVKWTTFSESIWWNVFVCKKDDCTQDLIKSIRSTFDMYLREKWKKYAPHFNSLVNKWFKQIGVWVTLDPKKKRYYITIHYATEVVALK